MSINDILEKIKPFYIGLLLLTLVLIFFALGRLSVIESKHLPIKIENQNNQNNINVSTGGEVIGVKTSKKYYFPWCGTLKRAKLENQIHFTSADLAKSAGYIAGGGCKGLK